MKKLPSKEESMQVKKEVKWYIWVYYFSLFFLMALFVDVKRFCKKMFRKGLKSFSNFFKHTKEKLYCFFNSRQLKNCHVAMICAIVFCAMAIAGVNIYEKTQMNTSIKAQKIHQTYETYVVKEYDGWDVIALRYKPNFMDIRESFFYGELYNYSAYLKEANPDIKTLDVGDTIRCPIFMDIDY